MITKLYFEYLLVDTYIFFVYKDKKNRLGSDVLEDVSILPQAFSNYNTIVYIGCFLTYNTTYVFLTKIFNPSMVDENTNFQSTARAGVSYL